MSSVRQLMQQEIAASAIAFKEVAGAASLAAIMNNRHAAPGCYLFRQKNTAGSNESISSVIQEIDELISIIIITRNVKTAKGADSSDENELFCQQVMQLLLNWKPSADYEPVVYAGGNLVSFRDGFFVWQEVYKTNRTICSQ